MLSHVCTCGAKYKLPPSALGKKAKCKKCGVVFLVKEARKAGELPEPSLDDDLFGEIAAAVEQSKAAPAAQRVVLDPFAVMVAGADIPKVGVTAPSPPLVAPRKAGSGYAASLLRALQFPFASTNNLIIFIFLCMLLCVRDVLLPFAFAFGTMGRFVLTGWFCAYRFDVLGESAAGREDLPSLAFDQGPVDDIIIPFFSWLGSWVFVVAPAFIFAMFTLVGGDDAGWDYLLALAGGLSNLLLGLSSDEITFMLLIYAGIFLWPMVALCVCLGGFETLLRPDLILLTIFKTLPAYVLTAAIVIGVDITGMLLLDQIAGQVLKRSTAGGGFDLTTFFGGLFVMKILAAVIICYFEILAVRCIGLYYYFQRNRFAWDWG